MGVGKEEECGAHSEYLQGMFGLRMYSCSLFEQFCPSKFPFLLWLKLLVCCTIELDRQAHRPLNEAHLYTSLFALRTNLGPRIAFLGPDLGHILVLVLGSILDAVLGPWILFVIVGAQNGAQKWNPKQGPKYNPNQDPKMQSGAPNLYGDANKDV